MQNEVVPALRQCVVATQASAVKLKIVDSLLWLHLPSQPTVTPVLMRSAVHLCTPSQSPIAGCALSPQRLPSCASVSALRRRTQSTRPEARPPRQTSRSLDSAPIASVQLQQCTAVRSVACMCCRGIGALIESASACMCAGTRRGRPLTSARSCSRWTAAC